MTDKIIGNLRNCTSGATAIEFAFAAPVLVMLMIGVLQLGMVLHANGGMRHAVGEGVRLAKVYPSATETQVLEEVKSSYSGINPANVKTLTFDRGSTAAGARLATISMSYEVDLVIPFAPVPPILLSQSRTVYLPV